MCEHCGCSAGLKKLHDHGGADEGREHTHVRPDGTVYAHRHDEGTVRHGHADDLGPHAAGARILHLEEKVLARNDDLAARNRAWLGERGIVAVNLISSPGSGKTTLLEKTLDALRDRVPCAVIAGDVQTDRDARRLEGRGARVVAIETRHSCHLDAERVARMLPDIESTDLRLLFIENVGNLVCPAAFDLGEHFKVALLSAAEGEDKPLKYPAVFSQAQAVIVTKIDLAPHLDWDLDACRRNIRAVQPDVAVFELSAKSGQGMGAWLDYILTLAHRTDAGRE